MTSGDVTGLALRHAFVYAIKSLRVFAVERDNWKNIYSPARLCHLICDLLPSLPGFVRCGRRGSRYGARHVDFAPFGHHGIPVASRSHAFSREEKAAIHRVVPFAAYSANQSDFRKRVTSRNTPTRTRTYLLLNIQWIGVYNHSHSLKFCHGSSLLTSPLLYTYNNNNNNNTQNAAVAPRPSTTHPLVWAEQHKHTSVYNLPVPGLPP